MLFHLVHEVGKRQRWRTTETLSCASANLISTEISRLAGITSVKVNARTGSVVAVFADDAARAGLLAYLAGLATNPPIRRAERASMPKTEVVTPDAASDIMGLVQDALPKKAGDLVDMFGKNRLVQGVSKALGSGLRNMPFLRFLRPVTKVFGLALENLPTSEGRGAGQGQGQGGHRLAEHKFTIEDADFDFGPLARFVFLRPILPIGLNMMNAVMGALPIIKDGFRDLLRGKLNVEVLDATALTVSILMRDFRTAGLLVLLLGMGEMLENYARKKSMASLAEQLSIKCDRVWVRDGEALVQRPLAEVTEDDIVVVRAGTVIPVDGVVVDGEAAVNQATMTGEPLPVARSAGGSVFAGTVVEQGEIGIRPTGVGDGTRLSQIIQFVEDSEQVKASIESKSTKFADAIVPFNFALAAVVFLVTRDLTRTASVLMVDYSCALRLSTPLAILAAMKEGTARGVVVKGGRFLEGLAEVDTIVFDKTGTLTNATPKLADVVSLDAAWEADEILRLGGCLEEHFPHPVSRAIVKAAEEKGLEHFIEQHDTEVQYVVAHGICSSVNGQRVLLGSRHFIEDDEGIDCSHAAEAVGNLASRGMTVLYIAYAGRLIGILGVEDPVREEAVDVVRELKARGKRVVMLTGDDKRTAAAVAAKLGIDEFRAQVLPTGKADEILKLKETGAKVLMVGDGINDSPALSSADVGVSMRDGTDIAQEVADVVLEPSLQNLVTALDLGEATLKRIKQNVGLSVGLNTGYLAGGLAGVLTPAVSALLHNATTIGVCLNAMRPELGHYEGETHLFADVKNDLKDLYNRASDILKETDLSAASKGARRMMMKGGR